MGSEMEVAPLATAVVENVIEDVVESSPPTSPVAGTKKMRRLRKVRETEIQENDVSGVDVVSEKASSSISEVDATLERRETAEEILKRFGKGEEMVAEGGKKRKAVQSTISAAVVDMAKQATAAASDVVVGAEASTRVVDNVEAENVGLELPSREEELLAGSEEIAPLSKRKRSSTVKRCSTHVAGMSFEPSRFEDEGEAMEDVENASGTVSEIQEIDQEGSDFEKGKKRNEEIEDVGEPSDSEKGKGANEDNMDRGGGVNNSWSDGWAEEEVSMEAILKKARSMIAERSNLEIGSAKPTNEKKRPSEGDLTSIDDQNAKKKKLGKKEEERIRREEVFAESQRLLRESKGVAFVASVPVRKPVSSVLEKIRQRRLQLGCSGTGSNSLRKVETKVVSQRTTKETSTTHVDLTVDEDTEVEIEIFSSTVAKTEEVGADVQVYRNFTQGVSEDKDEAQIAEVDVKPQDDAPSDNPNDEKIPEATQSQEGFDHPDLAPSISEEMDVRLELSQRIMDTQDLLCTSQLSPPTEESLKATPFEPVAATATDFMGLETQVLDVDEDLMPRYVTCTPYPHGQASSMSEEMDSRLELSQRILDTQDLLCSSQLSPATEESLETTPFEPVVATATDFMGLETQVLDVDVDLMPRPLCGDQQKQNKETDHPEVYTTATHVRGLIDDEAEDEDEDILAENAEEEEVLGNEEDLQDLIGTTEKEKAGDKARRDALHRKWLDQQDSEQTEDILERLRTGRSTRWKGRDRVVSCLDEDDDLVHTKESESLDNNSLSSQAGPDDPFAEEDPTQDPVYCLRQRMRSQNLEMDCLLDEDENAEDIDDIAREAPVVEDEIIEDDEEYEQSIIRKRLLEESEEQLAFMSPAEDESSREVLSLINKVNVGNSKAKSTPGHPEIRALGGAHSSSLSSKPSFLGRSSSSSSFPPPAHRQVGSGGSSRSFVFGRDDSNSNHALSSNPVPEEKKAGAAKSASDKGVSSTSSGAKKRSTPPSTHGPSLFEMLKNQSNELDQDAKKAVSQKWGSNTEAFSMFAPKKTGRKF